MHSYNLLSEFHYYLKKKPLAGCRNWLNVTRGQFLEGPEMCFHPESRRKISDLMITELLYLTKVTPIQEVSGVCSSLFVDTD